MRRTAHASCKSASIEISRARPRADASGPPRAHPRPRAPPRLESRACRKALMFRRAEAAPTSAANQMPVLTGAPKNESLPHPYRFHRCNRACRKGHFLCGFLPVKISIACRPLRQSHRQPPEVPDFHGVDRCPRFPQPVHTTSRAQTSVTNHPLTPPDDSRLMDFTLQRRRTGLFKSRFLYPNRRF
jgi:hypothetical protein